MAIRRVTSARRRNSTRTANPRMGGRSGPVRRNEIASGKYRGVDKARHAAGMKGAATRKRNAEAATRKRNAEAAIRKKRAASNRRRAFSGKHPTVRQTKGGVYRTKSGGRRAQKSTHRLYKGRTTRSRTIALRRPTGKVVRYNIRANPEGLFGIKKVGGVDIVAAVVGTLTASLIKNMFENMTWSKKILNDEKYKTAKPFIFPAMFVGIAVVANKTKVGKKIPVGVKTALSWAAVASIVLAVNDYADDKIAKRVGEMYKKPGTAGGYATYNGGYGGGYAKFGGASLSPLPRLSGAYVSTNGTAMFGGVSNAA